MLGRDGDDRSRAQGAEGKTHERQKLAAIGIEQRRVHFIAAAQPAVGPHPDAYAMLLEHRAGHDAQSFARPDRHMIRRMGHDLARGLLSMGILDQLDGLGRDRAAVSIHRDLEIRPSLTPILQQTNSVEILHFVQDDIHRFTTYCLSVVIPNHTRNLVLKAFARKFHLRHVRP